MSQEIINCLKKRGYDFNFLRKALELLISEKKLPLTYLDHPLSGNYKGHRECHIKPDWLLIYKIDSKTKTLILIRTGTHSDLF